MKITSSIAEPHSVVHQNLLSSYLALTKFRLLSMVLVSTGLGYYLALEVSPNARVLLPILFGVALVGGGANALNQWYERDVDRLMNRTKSRPLPAGIITEQNALAFGICLSVLGFFIIAFLVNTTTTLLSFISWASYLFIYTPLKRHSYLNTWIGAVPGALPAVLGWTAVTNNLSWGVFSLFAILYFWQLPHFFAISWVYKEDYKKGGFKMLSLNDPEGEVTSRAIFINTLVLLLASCSLYLTTDTGNVYLLSALTLGVVFLRAAIGFYYQRTIANARKVFWVSIIYLPTLFLAIIVDRIFL